MKDIFEKYRRRLSHIGIFRAVTLGLGLALLSVGVAACIAWAAGATLPVLLAVILSVGAAVLLVSSPLLYFTYFRPTDRKVAEELDALGLDERSITMYECRNDPSRMAAIQREDAEGRLSSVSHRLLKYTVALPIALVFLLGILFAAGATTASVLAAGGYGPAVGEDPSSPDGTETFRVVYRVYDAGTGMIDGEAIQRVRKGGFTEAVTAIPMEGFRFAAWVDEDMVPLANQNNPRSEVNVRGDMTIYAYFERSVPPATGDDPDADDPNGDEGEDKRDPDGGEDGPDEGDAPDPGEGEQGGEGASGNGGEEKDNNKVIDGKQDYKENFDRETLEDELADKDIPDDLKDILGDYYDTLKP